MEQIILPVKQNDRFAYNIYIEKNYDTFGQVFVSELEPGSRRVCIVSDSNVAPLYLDTLRAQLDGCCRLVTSYMIQAGEQHKTLDEIRSLYAFLIEQSFDRSDILIALGGGVIGDMTGFAAATYLRGIRFVQVPTTLLSQVDSSIGGKTGVDFDGYKNMVGAFHMPSMVFIGTSSLLSLPDEQFSSGMGEVLKHGLIRDADYYEWTIEHMSDIMDRDMEICLEMIKRSCEIKRYIVEKDPLEKGERALLNFGHTIGHAIEKLKDFSLLHGECVALGTVAAAYISCKREYLSLEEFFEIRDMNVGFDLPISFDGLDTKQIIETAKRDKKMNAGSIRFILLKKIAKAFIDMTVTEEEMKEAIDSINADTWQRD